MAPRDRSSIEGARADTYVAATLRTLGLGEDRTAAYWGHKLLVSLLVHFLFVFHSNKTFKFFIALLIGCDQLLCASALN